LIFQCGWVKGVWGKKDIRKQERGLGFYKTPPLKGGGKSGTRFNAEKQKGKNLSNQLTEGGGKGFTGTCWGDRAETHDDPWGGSEQNRNGEGGGWVTAQSNPRHKDWERSKTREFTGGLKKGWGARGPSHKRGW